MRAAYDQTRRGGTTVIVGVGRMDEMVSFSAFELFFNEKHLVGSYYGGTDVRADFHRLLRLYRSGKLDLDRMITRRIKLDEINDAMRAMERGEVVRQVIEF
jgi:S-(hydroxymethyl)glutathione dehydrogenase/alcohol dehydrogenase